MADFNLALNIYCARWRIVLATVMVRCHLWTYGRARDFVLRGVRIVS